MYRSPRSSAKATKPLSRMCWTTELEAQRALLVHVSCKISAQHHASPGQGCAICCSISDIDLGVVRGRVRRAVPQHGADHVERGAAA